MTPTPYPGTFAQTARGAVRGAILGLVAAVLLAEFAARAEGSNEGWFLALAVLYYGAIPAIALGALIGSRVDRRRSRLDVEGSLAGAAARAPTDPVGSLAGLLFALWAVFILMDGIMWVNELIERRLGATPAIAASAVLLLRVATLLGIWLIYRGARRAVSEAVDTRGGRPRLADVAIVAVALAFCAMFLARIALEILLLAPSMARRAEGAGVLGAALLTGASARALLRRSRYATHLATALATLIVGTTFTWWVLEPPADGADPLQEFRYTILLAGALAGFVWYVRWRLTHRPRDQHPR